MLINSLIQIFKQYQVDWTIFFRKLSSIGLEINEETKEKNFEIIKESCYENTSPDVEREISGWINH